LIHQEEAAWLDKESVEGELGTKIVLELEVQMEERAAGLPISLSIKKEWEYCKRAIRAIAVLISQNLMANMMHLMF